jgi:hypothetical protein
LKEVDASQYLNSVEIDFHLNLTAEAEKATILTSKNTMFNDAGKLMLNVNGESEAYGPQPVTGNGQLLAFVDIVGAGRLEFQAEWLGLWMEEDMAMHDAESNNLVHSVAGKGELVGIGGGTVFVFELPSEFGRGSLDVITNFDRLKGDRIALSAKAFSGLYEIKFKSVKGDKQLKKSSKMGYNVLYEKRSGTLYYDANGRMGLWGDGGEFAILSGAPLVNSADIVIA